MVVEPEWLITTCIAFCIWAVSNTEMETVNGRTRKAVSVYRYMSGCTSTTALHAIHSRQTIRVERTRIGLSSAT